VAYQDDRVKLLVLVSPSLQGPEQKRLKEYQRPIFVIFGDADQYVQLDSKPDDKDYQIIAGVDHFWLGHEEELADRVSRFFSAGFNQT
jgi:alpha/beta superfamily hydrolase